MVSGVVAQAVGIVMAVAVLLNIGLTCPAPVPDVIKICKLAHRFVDQACAVSTKVVEVAEVAVPAVKPSIKYRDVASGDVPVAKVKAVLVLLVTRRNWLTAVPEYILTQ